MSGGPLLLAFDAASPVGSVAVARGGRILARAFLGAEGEHARRLVPKIAEALETAGSSPDRIDGVVVGRGPGSFTGVRIAAATARGLCLASGVPLWPRSSLAAAAASFGAELPRDLLVDSPGIPSGELPPEAERRPRLVLFDARDDRVYAACYRFEADRMETLVAPRAATIAEVLTWERPREVLFCGAGALRHARALDRAGLPFVGLPAGLPTAEGLLRVHALRRQDPPEPAGSRWEPEYLRGSSARTAPAATEGAG